jgi:beta-lactamase class A
MSKRPHLANRLIFPSRAFSGCLLSLSLMGFYLLVQIPQDPGFALTQTFFGLKKEPLKAVLNTSPPPSPKKINLQNPKIIWQLQRKILLDQQLARLAEQFNLVSAGIMLLDLNTGNYGGYQEKKVFESASLVKLPIMLGGMREIYQGKAKIEDIIQIDSQNMTTTAWFAKDPFPELTPGKQVRLEHLFEVMISRSDNIATNTLLDIFNRQSINDYIHNLSFRQTEVAYKITGSDHLFWDGDYVSGINQSSAWDMGRMLSLVVREKILDSESCILMMEWLNHQQDKTKLAAKLPAKTYIAHKTGENSRGTHDVAIIKSPNHQYTLAVLTPYPADEALYQRISNLSRSIYDLIHARPSLFQEIYAS